MIKSLSKSLQKKLKEERNPRLPNPKQPLKDRPRYAQIGVLIVTIFVNAFFCWGFALSYSKKVNGTSNSSSNGVDILTCFPDVEGGWRVFALIFYEGSAALDLISSLLYLNTLTFNWFENYLTYRKHCSPIYTFIAAWQSVWIQQASLNCAESGSTGFIFSFSSFPAALQSVTIIVCIVEKIVESQCCCNESSWKECLKEFFKGLCTILQIVNVIYSIVLWWVKIRSNDFSPEWAEWPVLIFFPTWMFIRVLEYVINMLIHEQDETEDEPRRQVEMMANQQGGRDHSYIPPIGPADESAANLIPGGRFPRTNRNF